MAAGIEIYNYVTNQKGSPAIYSDTLTNRPAAGFIGRLFVSTDTLEIYRDNGTTWDLISGGGGPSVNIYNSNGTLTGARTMTMANNNLTFDGGANPARLIMSADNNITRSFSFATGGATRWAFTVDDNETGTNTGGNWYLRAYTDAGAFLFDPISVERATGEKSMIAIETLDNGSDTLTGVYNITGGTYLAGLTMIGGNPHGASHNNYTLANAGNLTFANSIYLGAQSNVLRLQANNSGTITLSPASPGIRTAAATLNQIQYNTTTGAAITYTHASVMQTLGFYRLFAAGSLTVTNAYGLIVNDLNEYGYAATGGGALVLTNRWGIYQDSTTDVNYLGGTTLIGTTTNAGYKLDVNGTLRSVNGANFATNGTSHMGMGVVPSAWSWPNGVTQFRFGGHIAVADNSFLQLGTNSYYDGSNYVRVNAGYASRYLQNDGGHFWSTAITSTAGSTVTFNEQMRMTRDGELLINTTSDAGDYKLQVGGGIYATNNSVNLSIATQNNRFIAGEYGIGVGTGTFDASQTNGINVRSGTAPTTNVADVFVMYAADITAGNAAPHFRTENGNTVKIYQETTGVGSATFASPGAGSTVKTDDTFDGYTLQQVVKALRNLGILA